MCLWNEAWGLNTNVITTYAFLGIALLIAQKQNFWQAENKQREILKLSFPPPRDADSES